MSTYITIDGGTTSTRVNLLKDGEIHESIKLNIGARAAIENRGQYVSAIKTAVDKLTGVNNVNNVKKILASGMITSEFGLCTLPHIKAPAGIEELHRAMHETVVEEISSIPFVFMRGVKTDSQSPGNFDMMRGEETELMGVLDKKYGDCVYVLPGSHSKIIRVDEKGRIASFCTMLTGEMLAALSQGTILKDAVELGNCRTDAEFLLRGYEFAQTEGINKALFKVRVLKNSFGCSKDEVYSFFSGAVLSDEIKAIIDMEPSTVVIGGRKQIKQEMAIILKEKSDKSIVELDEKTVDFSTSVGMMKIYEYAAD